MPIINDAKSKTHIIAAKCLENLNFVFKNVKRGNSKTASKNAISTGVIISFPMQNITLKEIKINKMQENLM